MKMTESKPVELNSSIYRIEGKVYFKFTKKEMLLVFLRIHDAIQSIKQNNYSHEITFDFIWGYNNATLYWFRSLTDEEKLKVKELRKQNNKIERKKHLDYVKKMARQCGLIK